MEKENLPGSSSIEPNLICALLDWRAAAAGNAEDVQSLIEGICGPIEYYICDCLRYGPKSMTGWWSDGVLLLEVFEIEPDGFKLMGVTWIDSEGLAPFEFDLWIAPNNHRRFAKTVFRIGMLDASGQAFLCDRNLAAIEVLENRPRFNHGWAMAVELTGSQEDETW